MARIVLIDDEVRLLNTLTRFLENQGHQVVAGESFAKVQDRLRPGRFEMLVTDIVMPDFTGMQVLREVVENRRCLEPVVLITGEPNLETASEAVRRGAFDYISKPVTKDKLLEAVARGLRHVTLLRERDAARHTEMELLKNLALLGENASLLSHEIRTPITSLRQALRAVADKLGVEDRVLVEELVTNISRIERMLGQTLSFARPLVLQRREVAIADSIRDAVAMVQRLPAAQQLQIETRCAPGLTPLFVDPHFVVEVLVNLLRNAAEAGARHAVVTADARDQRCVVEVADDGPGVPADQREEIFKPFHSSKDGGTGIGLAFCRKVVESLGGSIALAERPGPGACFQIEFRRDAATGTKP
jgi:two-component system sensor histidine kinase PilS (NtrC family)